MNKISIVLPVLLHNNFLARMTTACLQNIFEYTYPQETEIILVHNQAQFGGGIKNELRAWDTYLPFVGENLRLGKCLNLGIEKATADYICILANDLMIGWNCLQEMQKTLDDGQLDIVIPWLWRFGRGNYEKQRMLFPDGVSTFTFTDGGGNCSMFKKETYEKIGKFDENLFIKCDRDYLWRMDKLGIKCGMSLDAHATHLGSMTWVNEEPDERLFGEGFNDGHGFDNKYLIEKYGKC